MIKELVAKYRYAAREKRRQIFVDSFAIDDKTMILDLGSEDGSAIHGILDGLAYTPENIHIADIDADVVKRGGCSMASHQF